jgi:hypothetical protein
MGGLGSGGQNRLSAEAHVLRGTFRPDRHGRRQIGVGVELPTAPSGLAAGGRKLWRAVTESFELDAVELALLAQAGRTVDLIDRLEKAADSAELRQQRLVLIKLLAGLRSDR